MDQVQHVIELVGGHVDERKTRHTRVVFGHRVTAKDIFEIDASPQGQNPTQYTDLVIRAHIVEFGTLTMPVPLTVLLHLDSVDREDLSAACDAFQTLSAAGHSGQFLPGNAAILPFGFRVNDVVYNRVQFGLRFTGMDEVEADRLGLKPGIRRACFLIGKQIAQLSSADGTAEIAGPIPIEYFESLDAADVATLRGAAELWRQTFRVSGAQLSGNGRGPHSADTGNKDRVERAANSADAAAAT